MAGASFGDEIDDLEKDDPPSEGRKARAEAAANFLEGKTGDKSPAYKKPGEFSTVSPRLLVPEPPPPPASSKSWATTSSDEGSDYEEVKKGDGFYEWRKKKDR
jgi:hypothetical protein